MKIKWLLDALEIQGVGVSRIGESVSVLEEIGLSLIQQGIAKEVKTAQTKGGNTIEGGN